MSFEFNNVSSSSNNKVIEEEIVQGKIGLERDREKLYDRINRRVDLMIEQGLIEEAKQFHKDKNLKCLIDLHI